MIVTSTLSKLSVLLFYLLAFLIDADRLTVDSEDGMSLHTKRQVFKIQYMLYNAKFVHCVHFRLVRFISTEVEMAEKQKYL